MPPRYTADKLTQEQTLFLLGLIGDHKSNVTISREFEAQFSVRLPKSSLARWRKAHGDEMAQNAMLARAQARQLLKDLGEDPNADKFQVVIDTMEERLLTAMSEVNKQDPVKLIIIQQEEKRRKLKESELRLKERALELEREKVHGVALDRVKLGEEFSSDLLEYIGGDAEGLTWFRKHAKPFNQFIQKKYAEAKA